MSLPDRTSQFYPPGWAAFIQWPFQLYKNRRVAAENPDTGVLRLFSD